MQLLKCISVQLVDHTVGSRLLTDPMHWLLDCFGLDRRAGSTCCVVGVVLLLCIGKHSGGEELLLVHAVVELLMGRGWVGCNDGTGDGFRGD